MDSKYVDLPEAHVVQIDHSFPELSPNMIVLETFHAYLKDGRWIVHVGWSQAVVTEFVTE